MTRGNPFFVTEVIDAASDEVPATVRDAVLARVARLPEHAARLLRLLAVIPSRAERRLAEALSDGDTDALLHLERAGVLSGSADHVAFRHELARRAVEASLTVGEAVDANRRVLDALLAQPRADAARIVHHAVRAVRPDVLEEYGLAAATDAARGGAHRQAAETSRAVLNLAVDLDRVTRAELLTQRAYSLYVVNEYEAAMLEAESAISVAEQSGDVRLLAQALVVMARIAFFARGPARARQAAHRAVSILERRDDDVALADALIELARTHSNLSTVGIVAQPSTDALAYAERALEICDRLDRDDLRAQALCYVGTARLSLDDGRGAADLERSIALGTADTRLEMRVRAYVNAAGGAYRSGWFTDAMRYVTDGLHLSADGEFAAGEYRLRLTSAAVSASAGDWDDAIGQLRQLIATPGEPAIMALLARSLLVRLLARRGDPAASTILDEAFGNPLWSGDSVVAGPLAVAQLEHAWLAAGTPDAAMPALRTALDLARTSGHTAMYGELAVYLRRTGSDVPTPAGARKPSDAAKPSDVPAPWDASLAGRWREAVAGWRRLGERYEEALELVGSGERDAQRAGLVILDDLGATATIARVGGQHRT